MQELFKMLAASQEKASQAIIDTLDDKMSTKTDAITDKINTVSETVNEVKRGLTIDIAETKDLIKENETKTNAKL